MAVARCDLSRSHKLRLRGFVRETCGGGADVWLLFPRGEAATEDAALAVAVAAAAVAVAAAAGSGSGGGGAGGRYVVVETKIVEV